ncbi:MAG: efflux RND transporter permease subunit, partial [Myxococcota bacterium]
VFPEVELDVVSVQVPYPGASPSEVEQGIILAVEEEVRGLDGIKKVTSTAREGLGLVSVELLLGADRDRALSDVKSAVDRIVSFPEEAERPVVQLAVNRKEVISLIVYGDASEKALRVWAERTRDELLQEPNITQIDLLGARPLEISIEVSQDTLRTYNLTHDQIAGLVRQSSLELPGGGIKTDSGEVLVRTAERKDVGEEFGEIIVLSRPDGTQVKLGEIATIRDGFRETDEFANYEGKRAIMLRIFRVADQTPIEIADTVKQYVEDKRARLPQGLSYALWNDQSQIYRERIDLLLRNAYMGLVLVFVCLGLFLDFKLAFWVMLGIPISFLGSMLLLPVTDVSINMISLFAFIVTLGIVVDDAIVVGENIYSARQKGLPFEQAAIQGVKEIASPVVFSVTTTVVAFSPMFFVPGTMGKLFSVIPTIVVAVLLLSLFESLFILPAHLAHGNAKPSKGVLAVIERGQRWFSRGLERFIRQIYGPVIGLAVRYRYLSVAVGLATLIAVFGVVAGGRISFTFFPKIDGDVVNVSARLPIGAPLEDAEAMRVQIEAAARKAISESGGDDIYRGLYAQIGQPFAPDRRPCPQCATPWPESPLLEGRPVQTV